MNRLVILAGASLISIALLAGCESMNKSKSCCGAASAKKAGAVAVAKIRASNVPATQPALGTPSGTVKFKQMGDKVKVIADIQGLKPSTKHGFHIHEKGDLSAPDFSSAGAHYNPEGHPHAGPNVAMRHAGDLGNLESNTQGKAHLEMTLDNVTINGSKNPILGKSVIIHAKADDLTGQPSGNAGERIGGGVIEMKQ